MVSPLTTPPNSHQRPFTKFTVLHRSRHRRCLAHPRGVSQRSPQDPHCARARHYRVKTRSRRLQGFPRADRGDLLRQRRSGWRGSIPRSSGCLGRWYPSVIRCHDGEQGLRKRPEINHPRFPNHLHRRQERRSRWRYGKHEQRSVRETFFCFQAKSIIASIHFLIVHLPCF